MDTEDIQYVVRLTSLLEDDRELVDSIVELYESRDIREISDLHSKITSLITDISLRNISRVVESVRSHERATFVEAGVRAQGGT